MACNCKNKVNNYIDVSNIDKSDWEDIDGILALDECGNMLVSEKPDTLSTEDREKLNLITTEGDGAKYLSDDGTYKEVSTGGNYVVNGLNEEEINIIADNKDILISAKSGDEGVNNNITLRPGAYGRVLYDRPSGIIGEILSNGVALPSINMSLAPGNAVSITDAASFLFEADGDIHMIARTGNIRVDIYGPQSSKFLYNNREIATVEDIVIPTSFYNGDLSETGNTITFTFGTVTATLTKVSETEIRVELSSSANITVDIIQRLSGASSIATNKQSGISLTSTNTEVATITTGNYLLAEFWIKKDAQTYYITGGANDDYTDSWVNITSYQ